MMRRPICLSHFWFGLFEFWTPEKIIITDHRLLDIAKKPIFELFGGHFKLNEAPTYACYRQHKIYWQRQTLLESPLVSQSDPFHLDSYY